MHPWGICEVCGVVPAIVQRVRTLIGGAVGGALGLGANNPLAAFIGMLAGAGAGYLLDQLVGPLCAYCQAPVRLLDQPPGFA